MDTTVREGFLCPICMQDLGSFHKLQNHFEASHTAEDKAVFDQIKGLFSKAKGKFLGRDEFDQSSPAYGNQSQAVANVPVWEPQEFGATRSHFETFKKQRDARVDRFVIESNKVLIRLDKLIYFEELDKATRKAYEKNLVSWVKDRDVPFCPTCGDRFNLARRRHHCRLCGAIMCTKCSLFLTYDLASELVELLRKSSAGKRRRTQSISLTPAHSRSVNPEIQIRCCHDCYKILLQRKSKASGASAHQLLVLLYEKLQEAVDSASKSAPEYHKMAESLSQGEDIYDLANASELRFKMMKFYETIDVISKKIAALDTNDEEHPPPPIALRLQMSIRQTAHAYLQENMLTLQSLPSPPKLEALQKQRREEQEKKRRAQMAVAEKERAEAKRRQDMEREAALERKTSPVHKAGAAPVKRVSVRSEKARIPNEGWSSTGFRTKDPRSQVTLNGKDSDPLLEQINYVKQMLKQAERSNRKEEAESLVRNLDELKREWNKRNAVKAFSSATSFGSNQSSLKKQLNPFLEDSDSTITSSFSTREDTSSGNPFLTDESDTRSTPSLNPFLDDNEYGNTTFPVKSPDRNSPEDNPLLEQIRYVTKCLDRAVKLGNKDEVQILKSNLSELQTLHRSSSRS